MRQIKLIPQKGTFTMIEDRREHTPGQNNGEMEIDLAALAKDFARVFRKLWWLFLILAAAVTGGYGLFWYLSYTPAYRCNATFTVSTGDDESGSYSFYYDQNSADQLSKTFPYILESSYFNSVLLENLGEDSLNGTITAETVENSNMVTMTVESPDPQDAVKILETALNIYPETARFVLGTIQFNLIDSPETPAEPYNQPDLVRVLGIGVLAGAAAGVVVLGILAFFRRTAKSPEDMKRFTSLKCLAVIPYVKFKARNKKVQTSLSVLNRRLPYNFRESVRALQIRLEREMGKNNEKILMVTSTMPDEGKSTVAAVLAEMFALQGKKVLLIDGDLRKQKDAQILECGDGIGLADMFPENKGAENKIKIRRLRKQQFWFIGSTRTTDQPAGILSHPKLPGVIRRLADKMDYVILDTPPCGIFQDAALMEEYVDSVLYVIKYDAVPQQKIIESLSFLKGSGPHFLGYVFNAYPQGMNDRSYGRYGYGRYGYGRYGYSHYGYTRYGSNARQGDAEDDWDIEEEMNKDD